MLGHALLELGPAVLDCLQQQTMLHVVLDKPLCEEAAEMTAASFPPAACPATIIEREHDRAHAVCRGAWSGVLHKSKHWTCTGTPLLCSSWSAGTQQWVDLQDWACRRVD